MLENCLVNGEPVDRILISDRGLHYGDGLFETIAVRNGRCEFWDAHVERLNEGCARLRIPLVDTDTLRTEAHRLTQAASTCVLKIIITRGSGGRGYRAPTDPAPTRILMTTAWPDHPPDNSRSGVEIRLCETRLGTNPVLAGLKHLNRLEQILARLEWNDDSIGEGLMLDQRGRVIEGTFTNVFMLANGVLRTPALDNCGVAGVMRDVILEIARESGRICEVTAIESNELNQADEIFLTNSLIGIWPVRKLQDRRYAPGPVTRELQSLVEQRRASRHA